MMTPHGHKHDHKRAAENHPPPKYDLSGLHRDWRTWLIIGLMVAAIATYVFTLDEAVQPSGPVQGGPPAAAPANPAK
jgi:hypothetical protein